MHSKGSRHQAAESKLKERMLMRQDETNKRLALSESSTGNTNCNTYRQKFRSVGKPLIEQTRNVALEILNNTTPQQNSSNANRDVQLILDRLTNGSRNSSCPAIDKEVAGPHLEFQERRERELKFTAAGWKRDCHGKWFRDENVRLYLALLWIL